MYETCRAFKYVPTAEALTRSCTAFASHSKGQMFKLRSRQTLNL